MTPDWSRIRAQFPALENWTFLNSATYGQTPRCAVEAAQRHLVHRDELACSDFLAWFDDADRTRERVAQLVRCEPDDVAFIGNAAFGLSLLIGGIDWRPGDRVITLADEFPNNLYYPALLAGRGVDFVECPWDHYADEVRHGARMIVLSTVNYSSGFRPPLEHVIHTAHQAGALVCIDGTQSVGALAFDFARLRPDMLVVDAYKWMLTPNGAGFMAVSRGVREWLKPNVVGWRSHHGWREVDRLHHGAPEFKTSAEKYEGGMLNFPSLYAMDATIRLMLDIGPQIIETRVLRLAEACRQTLRRLGARLFADHSPHYDSPVIAARFEGRDASALARELKGRRVLVAARHGNLRVSAHFYNNEEDLERLAIELKSLL